MDRRNFVRGVGLLTVTGGLAGCSQGDSSDSANNGGSTTEGDSVSTVSAPSEVSSYLDGAINFDGNMEDHTGKDSVEVQVGVGQGGLGFGPAAIKVSPGTTVTWVWTGEGGAHNVVAESEAFDSGTSEAGAGVTFEHTFEESGTETYYCNPHKVSGMKGAVVVASE